MSPKSPIVTKPLLGPVITAEKSIIGDLPYFTDNQDWLLSHFNIMRLKYFS